MVNPADEFALHPIYLTFRNRKREREYRAFTDQRHRYFYMMGLVLSVMGWLSLMRNVHSSAPARFTEVVIVVGLGLMPLFFFIIAITALDRWRRLFHPLVALANLLAGFVFLYVCHSVMQSMAFLLSQIISVAFFAYFLLRIRFPTAVGITFAYLTGAGLLTWDMSYATAEEIVWMREGIYLLLAVCMAGGYVLERSTRQLFAQEMIIARQQKELEVEHARSEGLLLNILPAEIATRLKAGEATIADSVPGVSVVFSDIVGFTSMSSKLTAEEVVSFLNELFLMFDDLAETHGLEKIKTIGDAYMAVAGVPSPLEDHADRAARMGLGMIDALAEYNVRTGTDIQVRIGIHSGHVVAGVIGKNKFMYDLWGDTVNTASRMESNGVPGAIQISEQTRALLSDGNGDGDGYGFTDRGLIDVKGKGKLQAYLLTE